jgi:hypothetical protein
MASSLLEQSRSLGLDLLVKPGARVRINSDGDAASIRSAPASVRSTPASAQSGAGGRQFLLQLEGGGGNGPGSATSLHGLGDRAPPNTPPSSRLGSIGSGGDGSGNSGDDSVSEASSFASQPAKRPSLPHHSSDAAFDSVNTVYRK